MKETIKNLAKAFIGESQARNRYTMYAKVARDEGFEQIAELFLQTADNERVHAKWLFKMVQELKKKCDCDCDCNAIMVEADMPTAIGDTATNLKAAIAGEHYEQSEMYPGFAKIAEKEGLPAVAKKLRSIVIAEIHHEERYKKLLKEVEAGTIFKKDKETAWVCRECGFIVKGKTVPEKCPLCEHPQAFYQVQCETY